MYILDQLWYGNVEPGQRRYRANEEYAPYYKSMDRCEKALKAELSETGKKALEEFLDSNMGVNALSDCDNFIDGFRIGALMMMDVLSPPTQ